MSNDLNKETILITSTGAIAADIVIKNLKKNKYRVAGCNIYPKEYVVDSCNVDVFYQIPPVSDNTNYLESIKDICIKEDVSYIFPMIDYEIDLLNINREWFNKHNITLCKYLKFSFLISASAS